MEETVNVAVGRVEDYKYGSGYSLLTVEYLLLEVYKTPTINCKMINGLYSELPQVTIIKGQGRSFYNSYKSYNRMNNRTGIYTIIKVNLQ